MNTFNGHRNWNHWNVSLWISSDEGLHSLARDCMRRGGDKNTAAKLLLWNLQDLGLERTPDGAPYSVSSLRAALVGL